MLAERRNTIKKRSSFLVKTKISVCLAILLLIVCASSALALDGWDSNGTTVLILGEEIPINKTTGTGAYHKYWQYWCQGASIYSEMRMYGCYMVAQSKLLVEFGIAPSNVNEFNPDKYFELAGKSFWDYAPTYASKKGVTLHREWISLSTDKTKDATTIMNLLKKGYGCILISPNHKAYIGRSASLSRGEPVVLDSFSDASYRPAVAHTFIGNTYTWPEVEVYKLEEFPLTINSTGGTVSGATNGSLYKKNTKITLTAQPDADHEFVNWTCTSGTISDPSSAIIDFTMPASNATVTANYKLKFGKVGKSWASTSVTAEKTTASFTSSLKIEVGKTGLINTPHQVTDVTLAVSQSADILNSPGNYVLTTLPSLMYFKQFDTPTATTSVSGQTTYYTYNFSLSDISQLKNGHNSSLSLVPGSTYYYRWTCKVNDVSLHTETKKFSTKGTAVRWDGLVTNDQGLFNAWAYYNKADVSLKEVGCFVGASRNDVDGATPYNIPSGVARAMDKNVEVYDSGRGGTYVFYRATSFNMTFTPGVTYYYKFYSFDSTNDLAASSVGSYTVPGSAATYPLTIQAGEGGKITKGASGSYAAGNVMQLIAAPDTGYAFAQWNASAGQLSNAGSLVTSFTMPGSAAQVVASFTRLKYNLTVEAVENGSVNHSSASLGYNQEILLCATPAEGYEFAGWFSSGGGSFENAANANTVFTMPAEDVTVYAQFTAVTQDEEGWVYASSLPDSIDPSVVQVQYHTVRYAQGETSPGNDWTQGEIVSTRYVNSGGEYESDFQLATSETRQLVRYYYYHWCKTDGSDAVNYAYNTSKGYVHLDVFRNVSLSYEASSATDSVDSRYTYYVLKWKSNDDWVACKGGETCDNSDHPYRSHLWYKKYVYQDKQAINTYQWTLDQGWSDSPDENAETIRVRYRYTDQEAPALDGITYLEITDHGFAVIYSVTDNISVYEVAFRSWPQGSSRDEAQVHTVTMVNDSPYWNVCHTLEIEDCGFARNCWYYTEAIISDKAGNSITVPGEQCRVYVPELNENDVNRITLPGGTITLEEEAFAGNSAMSTVVINDGLTAIGPRAFANCANLRLVYIPSSVTQIADSAFENSDHVVLHTTNETAAAFARLHEIPYVTGELY